MCLMRASWLHSRARFTIENSASKIPQSFPFWSTINTRTPLENFPSLGIPKDIRVRAKSTLPIMSSWRKISIVFPRSITTAPGKIEVRESFMSIRLEKYFPSELGFNEKETLLFSQFLLNFFSSLPPIQRVCTSTLPSFFLLFLSYWRKNWTTR